MSKRFEKIAQRYAAALRRAVRDAGGDAKQVAGELQSLATLWSEHESFSSTMLNPHFSKVERANALAAVGTSLGLSEVLSKFIALVFENERIAALVEISAAFTRRVEQEEGIRRVHVRVAHALGAQEQAELEQRLNAHITGRTEYLWSVEPEILG